MACLDSDAGGGPGRRYIERLILFPHTDTSIVIISRLQFVFFVSCGFVDGSLHCKFVQARNGPAARVRSTTLLNHVHIGCKRRLTRGIGNPVHAMTIVRPTCKSNRTLRL